MNRLTATFKVRGIMLKVDLLLPLIVGLIAFLLAHNYFPDMMPGADPSTIWLAGIIGAISIILSILIHEAGHAFSATILAIPINSIHINLFGGIAELKHRPLFPLQEFYVALAGPLTSFLLGLIFYLSASAFTIASGFTYALIEFAGILNLALGAFNILPIFPLDGGRAVRSFFWYQHKNFFKASGTMHRFSSFVIGFIFIAGLAAFWLDYRYWAVFGGVLGLYTSYLVMDTKEELVRMPGFEELVYPLPRNASPAQIIEQLIDLQPDIIKRCIVPVIINHEPQAIIYGVELTDGFSSESNIEQYLKPLKPGTFIDRQDRSTFQRDITFEADIIPIFDRNELLGVADAQEARFWLSEMSQS